MPRVPDITMDSVQFLYRTADDARKHTKVGGTCFTVGVPVFVDGVFRNAYVPYLVSNRHVVWTGGCPVPRINRRDGGAPDVIELDTDDWVVHPKGDDVAVASLMAHIDQAVHKVSFLGIEKFVSLEMMKQVDLGVGEEVIMVGRLINHQGRRENKPIVRFGNISMMPELIWNRAIQHDQESFVVEMRSRTGFSGSPVAVYRTPATILANVPVGDFYALLGVNWGYILDEDGENTWLNGVVPAWKILETLAMPELRRVHNAAEDLFREAMKYRSSSDVTPAVAGVVSSPDAEEKRDDAIPSTTSANPYHKEDFTSLLNAAAKTKPQGD